MFAAAIVILAFLSLIPAIATEAAAPRNTSSVCCNFITEETENFTAADSMVETGSEYYINKFLSIIDLNTLANDFETYIDSFKTVFELVKKFFENSANSKI